MKVLVYSDIAGSGGYFNHFKGLFSSGVWDSVREIETIIAGSDIFLKSLGQIDNSIKTIPNNNIQSTNKIRRYYWHLWQYPQIVRRIKPNIEFFPSGNLKTYFRKSVIITMCRNLLPFDDHELEFYKETSVFDYWKKFSYSQGKIYERSNGVIFLSEYSKDIVLRKFPRIKNYTIIPHGIDEEFRLNRKNNYKTNDKINILYVSPIYHYKHHSEVLLAIIKLRNKYGLDIKLKLVGGIGASMDYAYFKKLFDRNNGSSFVSLISFVTKEQLLNEYRNADIFIFASSCECFPNTLLEAMSCGLPIACSNRAGLTDILKQGGLYFNPEEPDDIVKVLLKLITNEEARYKLGQNAFILSQQYSWKKCAVNTINYFNKIGKLNGI